VLLKALSIPIEWPLGWVDADFAFPLLTAVGLWMYYLHSSGFSIKIEKPKLWLHWMVFGFWTVFSILTPHGSLALPGLYRFLWFSFAAVHCLTFLYTFTSQDVLILPKTRSTGMLCLGVCFSLALAKILAPYYWDVAASSMGEVVTNILSGLTFSSVKGVWQSPYYWVYFPNDYFYIGDGCAGLDSIVFFILAWSFSKFFGFNPLKGKASITWFLLGMLSNFGLNIVRLVTIGLTVWGSTQLTSNPETKFTVIQIVHLNLGWFFVLGWNFLYLNWVSQQAKTWINQEQEAKQSLGK